jgi:alpha-aminoadipic semialdehyde synthase
MSRTVRIGIRYEDKSDEERRCPLTPDNIAELRQAHGLDFIVEPSPNRVCPDEAFEEAGAEVTRDLARCDLIVGIKEVPVERLVANVPHIFFSHTIKGQEYNMEMLQAILDKGITLLDYERVTDDDGGRLIAFSTQAGQAGAINTLWSLGQRLKAKGRQNPFASLKQARHYDSLEQAKEAIQEVGVTIREEGLPEGLSPLVIAVTGIGRVSTGAQELLDPIGAITLVPEDLLDADKRATLSPNAVYKVVLDMEHFLVRADGTPGFDFHEYLAHPWRYVSRFADFLPHLTAIVNGIYWEERFPRLVTVEDVETLFAQGEPKLQVIGDVTCDPEGSIQVTLEPTEPSDPAYVYNPADGKIRYGFDGDGLLVMAVDILPAEIPEESSRAFGEMLTPWLPELAKTDYSAPFDQLELPDEWRRAVIAHQGELTPAYEYLYASLEEL